MHVYMYLYDMCKHMCILHRYVYMYILYVYVTADVLPCISAVAALSHQSVSVSTDRKGMARRGQVHVHTVCVHVYKLQH